LGLLKAIRQTAVDVVDNFVVKIINTRIEKYGTVQLLKINRVLREIDVSLTLHGETVPVRVICKKYSFYSIEETIHARVESFSACRPWLNAALNDFAAQKLFPLDHPQARMIPVYLRCEVTEGE
jgi:hypothetical protein